MKKGIIISVVIYSFVIILIVLVIPFTSENISKVFSENKTEYKIYHELEEVTNKIEDTNKKSNFEPTEFVEKEYTQSPEEQLIQEKIIENQKPMISIVIDDYGYSFDESVITSITSELPITVAIIPFLEYSKKINELAKLHNKEVIIHLPMEAYKLKIKEIPYVKKGDKPDRIINILTKSVEEIEAVGLNNHMGSEATEDPQVMETIVSFLKKRNMFFLDSLTTPNSVGYKKARELGLIPLKRDVFLDNNSSIYYIEDQLRTVEKIANKKGYCIAIGHIRSSTIEALERWYQENKNNYEFIPLKSLYSKLYKTKYTLLNFPQKTYVKD